MVSFPPLIDMLKFSGYPYLIRGQKIKEWLLGARSPGPRDRVSAALEAKVPAANVFEASPPTERRTDAQHQAELEGLNDARTGMP